MFSLANTMVREFRNFFTSEHWLIINILAFACLLSNYSSNKTVVFLDSTKFIFNRFLISTLNTERSCNTAERQFHVSMEYVGQRIFILKRNQERLKKFCKDIFVLHSFDSQWWNHAKLSEVIFLYYYSYNQYSIMVEDVVLSG